MGDSINIKKMLENGLSALKKGKHEKALAIFEQIIKEEPSNTIAWNNKGVTLRKLGKLDEAMNCYNKVLGIEPKQIQALLNKARVFKIQKKFDLALFIYEDILEIEQNHEDALTESEQVRMLLSKRAKLVSEHDEIEQESEENELLSERKAELLDFLNESIKSISDSVDKINEIYISGIKEEALEHRDTILAALLSFNEQLQDRIKRISDEFISIDFIEENRDLIDKWIYFKDEKVDLLKKLV
ncbi:MAG: tetratricopeptide repeat protein [Asgard group archaeon]|nr:tetratricopeptide repeat protein [Asgard group archaeon]